MQAVERRNRRYRVIKGGLDWLLWQGGVVNSVVELGSTSVGLVVYRREEGEETVNTEQTKHHTKYNKAIRGARGNLTRGW